MITKCYQNDKKKHYKNPELKHYKSGKNPILNIKKKKKNRVQYVARTLLFWGSLVLRPDM